MDRYLRFSIKVHGYCIAIVSIILILYLTSMITEDEHKTRDWIDIRYTKEPAVVFEILWLVATVFLFAALIREKKWLVIPFCVMFPIDTLLCIVRFIYELKRDPWTWIVVIFYPVVPVCIMFVLYVILSMIALIRLFELDPNNTSGSEPARVHANSKTHDMITSRSEKINKP